MRGRVIAMALTAIACTGAMGKVVTYPAGPGLETGDDFSVKVRQLPEGDWADVCVYPVKVDQVTDGAHRVSVASMSYFDFDGDVEVKVVCNYAEVKNAGVRPLSYGINPEVNGDTLRFTLEKPANLSVEINGDTYRNLHLFANPIDTHRPTAKQIKKEKHLIYFGPGVHTLPGDSLLIPSNTTVYVEGGAWVKGRLVTEGAENVRFYGRGEIHPAQRGEGIYIRRSKNVEAEGVIVTQIPVGGSDGVKITNVKSISSYGWGDGMNVFASNNVEYDRVFCRNSDDCTTVYATRKGFLGGCKNITMQNSTLWADVAHPIMIGLHGAATEVGLDATPDTIQNLLYKNIDILEHAERQIDYQGSMAINCGDNNVVKNVVFEDIRVEDFKEGQLLHVCIVYNEKYCAAPGGSISNVLFKDVVYNGKNAEHSVIAGYDQTRKVKDICFENLVINGVRISDDMPGKPKWYKTGDMARIMVGPHVENLTFK